MWTSSASKEINKNGNAENFTRIRASLTTTSEMGRLHAERRFLIQWFRFLFDKHVHAFHSLKTRNSIQQIKTMNATRPFFEWKQTECFAVGDCRALLVVVLHWQTNVIRQTSALNGTKAVVHEWKRWIAMSLSVEREKCRSRSVTSLARYLWTSTTNERDKMNEKFRFLGAPVIWHFFPSFFFLHNHFVLVAHTHRLIATE